MTSNTKITVREKVRLLDQAGIFLSFICAIHCLLTPVVMLTLPIMARYYLANPLFHYILAACILPVGLYSFIWGAYRHRNWKVLLLGIPGLVLISLVPIMVHNYQLFLNEPLLVGLGSVMLISAHWINRKSCLHFH